MRTLNFSDVLYQVAQLCGHDRENLPTHFFRQVRDLANGRLSWAWESENWPDLLRISSQAVTDSGDYSTVTYPSDAGEVIGVWNSDPRATTKAYRVPTRLYSDGSSSIIDVLTTTDPVFVEYRIKRPVLRGNVYDSSTTYVAGQQIYFTESDGDENFYDVGSTVPAAGESPTTDASKWDLVKIPYIFHHYLVRGIYADYLRANGQPSDLADRDAEAALALEADKLYRQQGQARPLTMLTSY